MTFLITCACFALGFALGGAFGRWRGRRWGRTKAAEVAEHGRELVRLVARHPHGRQALREAERALAHRRR